MATNFRRSAVEYGVAVAASVVALLARELLDPFLDHRLPFITFLGAVAVAVAFGGWRPGLLAMALGYAGAQWWIIESEPGTPLSLRSVGGAVALAAYLASCSIIIGFGSAMRAARRRAESSARHAIEQRVLLEREVADRKRAEQALARIDRRKDEFLAMLAHELRGPLAPIRNAAHILRVSAGDAQARDWARSVVERQVEHMTRLVEDLLDVSRIASGKLELRRRATELGPVVLAAIEACRPEIDAARQTLTVEIPPEPIHLDADPTRLVQVFQNLLRNASRYTLPEGHIALTARLCGDEAIVAVEDDGIGISADALPHIFEMFVQGDRGAERSRAGLGIGLALARRLVELHGGSIEARSGGRDRGSAFLVRLAARKEGSAAGTPAPREAESRIARRFRILIADDDRDAAQTLGLVLSMHGHETRIAYDGLEAVEVAHAFAPDAVLLDLGMPKLDGYEAARRIRARARPGVALIAVTGWSQPEVRRHALAAGFDFHLVKPVEIAELEQQLLALEPGERRSAREPR